jgi:excisionase family DNA binding protein
VSAQLLTPLEAAAVLRCSPRTVRRLVAAGELPAYRRGRVLRVRSVDLDAHIQSRIQCRTGSGAPTAGVVVGGDWWD